MLRWLALILGAVAIVAAAVGITLLVNSPPRDDANHVGPIQIAEGKVGDADYHAVAQQRGTKVCLRITFRPSTLGSSSSCGDLEDGDLGGWGAHQGPARTLWVGSVSLAVATVRIDWRNGTTTTVRPLTAPRLARQFWIAQAPPGVQVAKITVSNITGQQIEHATCSIPDGTGCSIYEPGERE